MSLILLIIGFASIILLICVTYRKAEAISKGDVKRYATFYCEFKCDRGFKSMIFYPIFFIRRFCYIAGLYFLEDYPGI